MGTLIEAKGNYIKVAVYSQPNDEHPAPYSAARRHGAAVVAGTPSATRERVDSFVWPFTTNAEAGRALEAALAVFDEAQARGLAAQLSIFKPAPEVRALDAVAVVLLRELGDEYDD